jgi:hypothetical protein
MISFYQIQRSPKYELHGDWGGSAKQFKYTACPKEGAHKLRGRRTVQLHYAVKHNDRNEHIIWGMEVVVHASVAEKLTQEGFTGFRAEPAQVTFLDGVTSDEYRVFTVTGWAGVVRPESGMRLLDSCPDCLWKDYGPITDFSQVIDWDQWTGEDFFIVWPLIGHRLCSERAAKWLEASGIRSFCLGRGFELLEKDKRSLCFGIPRGPLSEYLPEDLAIKYGRPLGLE